MCRPIVCFQFINVDARFGKSFRAVGGKILTLAILSRWTTAAKTWSDTTIRVATVRYAIESTTLQLSLRGHDAAPCLNSMGVGLDESWVRVRILTGI